MIMDYLQNHCFCRDSYWFDGTYWCRHLVNFNKYEDHNIVDWDNLIDENSDTALDEFAYRLGKNFRPDMDEKELISKSQKPVKNLKPHVLQWLHDNVKDRKDSDCTKGWDIGSTDYRATESSSFTIFFHRKNDAMAFIRQFSIHKKPVHYCQYFSDVRKELDLNTGKYHTL